LDVTVVIPEVDNPIYEQIEKDFIKAADGNAGGVKIEEVLESHRKGLPNIEQPSEIIFIEKQEDTDIKMNTSDEEFS